MLTNPIEKGQAREERDLGQMDSETDVAVPVGLAAELVDMSVRLTLASVTFVTSCCRTQVHHLSKQGYDGHELNNTPILIILSRVHGARVE